MHLPFQDLTEPVDRSGYEGGVARETLDDIAQDSQVMSCVIIISVIPDSNVSEGLGSLDSWSRPQLWEVLSACQQRKTFVFLLHILSSGFFRKKRVSVLSERLPIQRELSSMESKSQSLNVRCLGE